MAIQPNPVLSVLAEQFGSKKQQAPEKKAEEKDYGDIAKASTQAVADLASGIFKAKLMQEQAQREIESGSLQTASSGKFKDIGSQTEAQINPLKTLIANYRASIK